MQIRVSGSENLKVNLNSFYIPAQYWTKNIAITKQAFMQEGAPTAALIYPKQFFPLLELQILEYLIGKDGCCDYQ